MSAPMTTVRLRAALYEDHDDCLAAAVAEYSSEHDLEGWDLSARWEDDNRDTILLTVPADVDTCTCATTGAYLCLRCERIAESQDIGF